MPINRRRFVKAFGGTLAGRMILGPVATSLAAWDAKAQTSAVQPKYISFVTPLGHHYDWDSAAPNKKSGTGDITGPNGLVLSDICQSLEPHKNQIMYLRDVWSEYRYHDGMGAHRAGYPASTTGAVNFEEDPSTAAGISIDQYLINKWNAKGQSLEMSVGGDGDYTAYISWAGNKKPIIPAKNPRDVFDATFRGLSEDDPKQVAYLRAKGQSLLDVWTQEIQKLDKTLGQDHRIAMEAHLEQLNQLEKSINEVVACSAPDNLKGKSFYDNAVDNFPTIGKHFMDITVSAFSCGVRRTASLAWSDAGSKIRHKWVGINQDHHGCTHGPDTEGSYAKVKPIDTWYTEQFAYLLKNLKDVNTGDGSLLDSTVIYWGSETGDARSHSGANMRIMVAGNYNNHFKMGRFYRFYKRPINDVLAEICVALGAPIQKFGNPDFATGQLPEIRA